MTKNYTQMPVLVIVDSSESDLTATRELLISSLRAHVVGAVRDVAEVGRFMQADPDIVLLDVGINPLEVPAMIRRIQEMSPRCQVVLTAPRDVEFDLSRAMLAGARGLVAKPVAPGELLGVIQDVFEAEQLKLRRLEDLAKASAVQGRGGEIITVFSPKGGVGCTTIATNLALALANITQARVALVDFSLQFGDVAVLLNLHSSHGIHELMRNIDDLDSNILDDVMVTHSSGVRVLLPPPSLELVEEVATDGMTAVLKALRKSYDFVVVDTWHSIEDATLAVIDLSNTLLMVTTPEVPALRSTRRLLDLVRERPDLRGKVQIVVNRYPSKSAVGMKEIEHSLGLKPVSSIPSDGQLVTAAVNEGVSFLSKPSPTSNSITQLAISLAQPRLARENRNVPAMPEEKKRLGGFFRRAEGKIT
jgi:pilus assembly protein CpaE